jgi:hypothetical protein
MPIGVFYAARTYKTSFQVSKQAFPSPSNKGSRSFEATEKIYKKVQRTSASLKNEQFAYKPPCKSPILDKVKTSVKKVLPFTNISSNTLPSPLAPVISSTSDLESRKITLRIKRAPLWNSKYADSWHSICQRYYSNLNMIHLVCAMHEFVCKWMDYPPGPAKKLLKENQGMFERMKTSIILKIDDLNPREISSLAWSYAKLGLYDEKLFELLTNAACKKIHLFNSIDLSALSMAFSELGIDDRVLFAEISKATLSCMGDLNVASLVNIAWTFANLNIKDEALFRHITEKIDSNLDQFDVFSLSKLLWSFTILFPDSLIFNVLFKQLDKYANFLTHKDMMQIYHADLALNQLYLHQHKKLHARIRRFHSQKKPTPCSSETHKDVMKTLDRLGLTYDSEVKEKEYYLDIVMKFANPLLKKFKILLEVNGPYHYLKSKGLKGRYVLKQRILQMQGWTVVQIDHKDWDVLQTAEKRETFLQNKLEKALEEKLGLPENAIHMNLSAKCR